MTHSLREAGVGIQIVAYAYFALLILATVVMAGGAVVKRRRTGKGKLPNPVEAVIGVGVVIGFPAALAAALAFFISPVLVAMPLPLAGWVLIGAMAIYGFIEGERKHGCTKLVAIAFSGFGLCWAAAAILFASPPVGDALTLLRPVLLALPLALVLTVHRKDGRARQTVGFTLLFAILLAVAFLPVERGFGASWLPASDWLRFPIMGAIVFGAWPLLAIPMGLMLTSRGIRLREQGKAALGIAAIGGLFGLVWAFTRLIF